MDSRYYEYIIAIAQTGNISKAAETLYVSQPTLSKFLINLEEKLGVKLFTKIDGKFIPTVSGELYINYGTKILEMEKILKDSVEDVAKLKYGKLSVAITPTRNLYILPKVLPKFRKLYPQFNLNILEESIDKIENDILNKKVKLGIYIADELNKNLEHEILQEEEVVICINSDSKYIKFAEKKEGYKFPWIDLRYLKEELFFISNPETAKLGKIAKLYFNEYGINPKTVIMKNMETRLRLASIGEGVAFTYDIGEQFFLDCTQKATFLSIGKVKRSNKFIIAYLKKSLLDKPHCDFIDMTKDIFNK